jgi:hypothetical protein
MAVSVFDYTRLDLRRFEDTRPSATIPSLVGSFCANPILSDILEEPIDPF